MSERLKERASEFPRSPGVYLFRGESGEVIYVGKARSLRARVRSYFGSTPPNTRTLRMLNEAHHVEYMVTDNEVEALILESNLIKRYRPKYNIRLRDDKHYPYVVITTGEEFPRVHIVRRAEEDDHRYFGPFTTSGALRQTLELLRKVFPYRTCSDHRMRTARRPCLHHQLGRCLGPCADHVDARDYQEVTDGLIRFFSGGADELISEMRSRMERAAEDLDFEEAAGLRDQLRALEHVAEKQKMIHASSTEEQDVVGMARRGQRACVTIMFMREGRMVGQEHCYAAVEEDDLDSEVLGAVLRQYYADVHMVPRRIEVPRLPSDSEIMARWLSERRGTKVFLHRPQRGERRHLVEMASRNAELRLMELDADEEDPAVALAHALDLPRVPHRIECYDISNIGDSAAVGSMVVFEGGLPARYAYRRFRIREVRGPDDVAMMTEVLQRRLERLSCRDGQRVADGAQDPSFSSEPDLLMLDGGAGQLSGAVRVLEATGTAHIPVLALAKREELVYLPGRENPLRLPRDSVSLRFLQRIRDEAHRFAVSYHRSLRRGQSFRSILDDIPGIGAKRRNALLRHFDSLASLACASVEEIAEVQGMTRTSAAAVHRFLAEHPDLY